MRSLFAVLVVACTVSACGMLGKVGRSAGAADANKKDCAACEKMCSVAADAEKNPKALDSCKADCKKSCQ